MFNEYTGHCPLISDPQVLDYSSHVLPLDVPALPCKLEFI
jgi:hypothetical protein